MSKSKKKKQKIRKGAWIATYNMDIVARIVVG